MKSVYYNAHAAVYRFEDGSFHVGQRTKDGQLDVVPAPNILKGAIMSDAWQAFVNGNNSYQTVCDPDNQGAVNEKRQVVMTCGHDLCNAMIREFPITA